MQMKWLLYIRDIYITSKTVDELKCSLPFGMGNIFCSSEPLEE